MSSLKEVEEHQRDSAHRAEEFCREHQRSLCKGIDRLFLWLMALQWAACIALWGWNGAHYPSLWMVLLLGGAMAGWPAYHAFRSPGMMLTRQTMALGQMLLSSLLIHLSGSRPETHFHVFISFALLAFYRDWRVLVSASVVAIASPLLETGYQLLLGGVPKGPVDWAEYIGWILFLDTFLLIALRQSRREMVRTAQRMAALEALDFRTERSEWTAQLEKENAEHDRSRNHFAALQHRYGLIVNSIAEGILCIDQAGSISFENPAAARLLGWNAGELIGRSAGSTFRPRPGNGNAKGGGLKSMHSENDRRVDNEVFWRRDGTSFPVEYTSTAVQNDGGELIGEVLVFNDITERRRTQEELLHSRTMLQTIVDHLPQRVFWKGTDLAYIGCNRPFAQDAGLASPAEIIGKTDFDFCWRESAERYRKDDAEVMATRTAKSQYMEMQDRGDGSIAWLRTSKVPFYDNEGRVFAVLGTYEDVTELQHAEVALQESEERFRLGFEFAGIGMALVSLQGHWLKVNEKICEILGYSSEDLLVTTFQELSHPEDLDADLHEVGRLIAGELRSYQIEKRYFHKKGHVVFAFLTASIVRNAAGEALYFISQVEDITERKRNEAVQKKLAAELAGERRHLHEILNSVPAVVFETCNPAAAHRSTDFVSNYVETMYGYTAQEWLSTPGFSLSRVHPEDQPRLMEVISEVFAGRRVNSQLVFRVLARDGRVVWGETHLVAMHDEAGTLLGIRGVTLDVSERMHAQQELQWKTALLEAQVDATLDGILVVDSQGKQIVQSRQFTRMWNLPQHILDAQDDEMILQFAVNSTTEPEQFLKKITYLYDHLDETSHDEIELTNGSVFDRYSAPVLGKDGTYYGRIWTFRDISDRRRAEMEMERMHKQFLEVSRQAGMTEVATSVLHNVGNVLNSVNVSCAVVSDKVRRSRIGSVAKTAELLQAHTDDLGAFFCSHPTGMKLPGFFSKLSERLLEEQVAVLHELELLGRNIEHIKEIVAMQQSYANVSGVREKLFLKDLVEDTLRMNGAALNRHQLDIVREFEEVPAISMEKHKVLQILVNLIKNAKQSLAESQHPHKQLIVRIARSGPAFVAVSVSDNGIGIPAENLTRIFGHGFTTKKEGHGFGLHSGVLAAQQMGGSLSVRSAGPGRGATFTLELPIENIGHH